MGNKRKAIAIILGVFFFAFVTISSAFMSVKFNDDDNTKTNAATVEIGGSLNLVNTQSLGNEYSATIDVNASRKYLIMLYGQQGGKGANRSYSGLTGQGGVGGVGAKMYGFLSSTSTISCTMGKGGALGGGGVGSSGTLYSGGQGGGFTSVNINFALPAGQVAGQAMAGGGGGGGSGWADRESFSVGGAGGAGGVVGENGFSTTSVSGRWGGNGATQSGIGGASQNGGSNASGSSGGAGWSDATFLVAAAGGGGGGYYGGGGGGRCFSGAVYCGGGGGGSSSPNLYNKATSGAADSTFLNGGIQVYDISPTRNPVGNKTMIGTTATITAGAATDIKDSASKSLGRFEYSENAGSSWTTTAPVLSTVGKKTVYWRYVIGFDTFCGSKPTLSVVAGGVNTEGTLTLEVVGGSGSCTAPTITPDLTYIGETAQQVVKTLGTASGTFTFAVSKDSLTTNLDASSSQYSSLKWCTSLTDANNKLILKANEQYYVYYYSKQTTNGYLATTVQKVTLAKIKKATINLSAGTLKGLAGAYYGKTWVENTSPYEAYDVFTGAATKDKSFGRIDYMVSSSSTSAIPARGISMGTASDGWLNNTWSWITYAETYYLWYRIPADDNWEAVAAKYTGASIKVEKGNFTSLVNELISGQTRRRLELAADKEYDGKTTNFYDENTSIPLFKWTNSTTAISNPASILGTIRYKRIYEYPDNLGTSFTDYEKGALNAGRRTLVITWDGTENVLPGSKTIGTHTVSRTSNKDILIGNGLELRNTEKYNGKLGYNLVLGGTLNFAVNGTMQNTVEDPSQMPLDGNITVAVNQSYTVAPTTFLPYSNILSLRGYNAGVYYIWIKVGDKSRNFLPGVTVPYPQGFVIEQLEAQNTSVYDLNEKPYKIYDGIPEPLYTGNFSWWQDNNDLTNVLYALGTRTEATGPWQTMLSDMSNITAVDAGNHYLWVKWKGNDNISSTADTGRIVTTVPFKILQKTVYTDLNFSGITKTPDTMFNNTDIPYGTGTLNVAIESQSIDLSNLGKVTFSTGNVGTALGNFGYLESATGKDYGSYYLWVNWGGTDNIAPGRKLYGDIPLNILKASAENLTIENDSIKVKSDIERVYTGSPLSLFYGSPIIKTGENTYTPNSEIKFALTYDGSSYPSLTSAEWKTSLAEATQTNVRWNGTFDNGTLDGYYLWVLIQEDTNISQKVILINENFVSILQKESYVAELPTDANPIYNATDLVLINGSTQLVPPVEYSMDGINFTNNPDDMKGFKSGEYTVYYRGAADSNHFTQSTILSIIAHIRDTTAGIKTSPKNLNPMYNARSQIVFTEGMGTTVEGQASVNIPLEYSFDEGDPNDKIWVLDPADIMKTNVGSYTLYFRAVGDDNGRLPSDVASILISISKAVINISSPTIKEESRYNAKDKSFIMNNLTFNLTTNSSVNDSNIFGGSGRFEYGISTSSLTEPTEAKSSYLDVVAKNFGKYYLWYRVWAGDSHLGTDNFQYRYGEAPAGQAPKWVCFTTENKTAEILQAWASDCELSGFTWVNDLRYNATYQTPVTGTLVQKINANIVDDSTAKVWYALTDSPNKLASDSIEWKDSLDKARQIEAGEYYLHIKVEESKNIAENIKCLTSEYNLIYILPAISADVNFVGLKTDGEDKMYNGQGQTLASGQLSIQMVSNGIYVTSGIPMYMFTTDGINAPSSDDANWQVNIQDAKVTNYNSTGYFLWVKVSASRNINEVIKKINADGKPVYILKADETNIIVTAPVLEGKEFNTKFQSLVSIRLMLELANNNFLDGALGKDWYYVTSDKDEIPDDSSDWKEDINDAGGINAKAYYVWYKMDEGDNHNGTPARRAGTVQITPASGSNVLLSGISLEEKIYNGLPQTIASGSLVQKIGTTTVTSGQIQYAASVNDFVSEWKDSLEDVKVTDVDGYYIWVKVGKSENILENIQKISNTKIWIMQAPASSVKLSGIALENKVYNGLQQSLATGNLIQEINGTVVQSGEILFGVSIRNDIQPLIWSKNLDDVTRDQVGDYYLWTLINESNNIEEKVFCFGLVNITKGQAVITPNSVEAYNDLIYIAAEQELIKSSGTSNFQNYGGIIRFTWNDSASLSNPDLWNDNYKLFTKKNAGTYTLYYAVLDDHNWVGVRGSLQVIISQSEALFSTIPTGVQLVYNDEDQMVYSPGVLHTDSLAEGCYIQYSFDDSDWYNQLPDRQNAGTYNIYYRTISGSQNYKNSGVSMITSNIDKRYVYWNQKPESIGGLKQNGAPQNLVTVGDLTKGGIVLFSTNQNNWTTYVPQGSQAGNYIVWYKVDYDSANNIYDETQNGVLPIRISTLGLSLRGIPQPVSLTYNAEEQIMKWAGELSFVNVTPDIEPYIEYSFDNINWLGKNVEPTKKDTGKYTIYYKVNYDARNFDFYGQSSGSFVSEIKKASISENQVVAIMDNDRITYKVLGSYSEAFINEFKDNISYDYRLKDEYTTTIWMDWEGKPTKMGRYEIRARMQSNDNFNVYVQSDNITSFDVAFDITVNIHFEGDTRPIVRVWLDFTGKTDWKDATIKAEGIDKTFTFKNMSTSGEGGNGFIRAMYISNGKFYYALPQPINKQNIKLTANNTSGVIVSFNTGLQESISDLYICEVYRITYNANGGNVAKLPQQGWKWYDIPYTLAENNLDLADRLPFGWNTTAGGLGIEYRNDLTYTDNISRTFYAQFIFAENMTHQIRWVIESFELSSTGIWFNPSLDGTRKVGQDLLIGSKIMLPDIPDIVFEVYGKYVSGWELVDGGEYVSGMTANRDCIFKAVLKIPENKNDYVEFIFENNDGDIIKRNRVANGAASYMALSGLKESDFKRYAFDEWANENIGEKLTTSGTSTDIYYRFVTEITPPTPDEPNVPTEDNPQAFMTMFIIVGFGLVLTSTAGVIYLTIRKKNNKVNFKKFKEDR